MAPAFRPFRLFGLSHFAGVIGSLFVIVFFLRKLSRVPRQKLLRSFQPVFGVVLLAWAALYRAVLLIQGDFSLARDLPFHLCGISTVLLGIYLLRPIRKLYDVLFYWILAGSTLALIFPDLQVDFPSFRYFGMFVGHTLPLFGILYLYLLQDQKPSDWGAASWKWLNLLALFLLPVNWITGGNYLFLRSIPAIDFGPVRWLPPWPWYLLVLEIFVIAFFRFLHLLFVEGSFGKKLVPAARESEHPA